MNMNSGQDNSSIELWKAQQARVLSNDSIAVDYFCVSNTILNNIVLEKLKMKFTSIYMILRLY